MLCLTRMTVLSSLAGKSFVFLRSSFVSCELLQEGVCGNFHGGGAGHSSSQGYRPNYDSIEWWDRLGSMEMMNNTLVFSCLQTFTIIYPTYLEIICPGWILWFQTIQGELCAHLFSGRSTWSNLTDRAFLYWCPNYHSNQGESHGEHQPHVVVCVLPYQVYSEEG